MVIYIALPLLTPRGVNTGMLSKDSQVLKDIREMSKTFFFSRCIMSYNL